MVGGQKPEDPTVKVTITVPKGVLRRAKKEADRQYLSVSAYFTRLARDAQSSTPKPDTAVAA